MAPDGRHEIDINQKWSAMNKLKYLLIFAPLLPLNLHIRTGKQISWTPLLHLHLKLTCVLCGYFIMICVHRPLRLLLMLLAFSKTQFCLYCDRTVICRLSRRHWTYQEEAKWGEHSTCWQISLKDSTTSHKCNTDILTFTHNMSLRQLWQQWTQKT